MTSRAHRPQSGLPDDYGAGLVPGERRPARYAATAAPSRGRRHPEPECTTRSPFQRDRDRIIHSTAFRRLTYKTQMFVFHEGDYYRTRLTHTLEVAQIARTIARQLCLDEDLAETLALAHDLGHPPFGHAGERALDRAMAAHGGFDHNVQSFRIVTQLESKYPEFEGLNLAWETLEGLIKHNGPPALGTRAGERALVHALRHFDAGMSLALDSWGSAESQVAALADDVAWHTHDIDDGLRAGLIVLGDLDGVPLLARMMAPSAGRAGTGIAGGDSQRHIYGVVRRLITELVADAVAESRRRLAALAPQSPGDIRAAGRAVVSFSPAMTSDLAVLREFLFARLYRSTRVQHVMQDAEAITIALLDRYAGDPASLPERWRQAADARSPGRRRMRLIADFVAGMTDRYAIAEHRRLFDATPDLR